MTVVWRPAGRADVFRIVAHIAKENPVAAQTVARELFVAAASLAVFPRRGRWGRVPNTRELVIVRPYIIVYRVNDHDAVTILRVWHGAQSRAD